METTLTKITTVVFFFSLIILSIIQIEDTDIWVHLSIGREIFNLWEVPLTQPFAYPSIGLEFRYASWMFGLLLYVMQLMGGFAGIVLLKSAIVFLAVVILYKDSITPYKERLVTIIMLTVFVVISRYRFVERPDIVLMVLMPFTIYALNAYVYMNRKYIYALPFVAVIWAGCHSSIILILVPFLAFIVGGVIQLRVQNRMQTTAQLVTTEQIKTMCIVCILSITATFVNQHPLSQYLLGYGALTMKWGKQHIVELGPLTPSELTLLCIGIAVTLFSFALNWKKVSYAHLLLVLPFFVLPFSARRFIYLFILITAPVVARNISGYVSEATNRLPVKQLRHPFTFCTVIAWIVSYTVLGLAGTPPIGHDVKLFGLGVNESRVPAGAIRYMDKNGVYGRMFNPFHWGGYIIWTGYPKRTVFVDPMAGLSEELLEKYSLVMSGQIGSIWMLEHFFNTYGFDAVLLDYPSREKGAKKVNGLVLSDPRWALVYWDDTSLLYLRRNGRYQAIVNRDEYHFINPAAGRNGINNYLSDPVTLGKIELDLIRNIQENPSAKGFGLLGHLHSKTGRNKEALSEFSKVLEYRKQVDLLSAYTGLGTVYFQLGDLNNSLLNYKKAVTIQKDENFLYNLATIYVATGDNAKAVKTLREAIKINPDFEQALSLLAAINNRIGK